MLGRLFIIAARLCHYPLSSTFAEGVLLICDHTPLDESARSQSLYMTESEQVQALTAGGFMGVEVVLSVSKLVLYVARRTSEQEPPG